MVSFGVPFSPWGRFWGLCPHFGLPFSLWGPPVTPPCPPLPQGEAEEPPEDKAKKGPEEEEEEKGRKEEEGDKEAKKVRPRPLQQATPP